MTPAGVITVLHSFAGGAADGDLPQDSRLIQATDGNFYGTTHFGGLSDSGTVFRMTPAGAVTMLHLFAGGPSDGAYPDGLIQTSDGNLDGTTSAGGGAFGHGTVFHVTGGGDVTLLHSFNSTDGSSPLAGLMRTSGGHLYGTTFAGGTSGSGVVFHISLAPGADFDGDGTSDVFW